MLLWNQGCQYKQTTSAFHNILWKTHTLFQKRVAQLSAWTHENMLSTWYHSPVTRNLLTTLCCTELGNPKSFIQQFVRGLVRIIFFKRREGDCCYKFSCPILPLLKHFWHVYSSDLPFSWNMKYRISPSLWKKFVSQRGGGGSHGCPMTPPPHCTPRLCKEDSYKVYDANETLQRKSDLFPNYC